MDSSLQQFPTTSLECIRLKDFSYPAHYLHYFINVATLLHRRDGRKPVVPSCSLEVVVGGRLDKEEEEEEKEEEGEMLMSFIASHVHK